MARILDTAKAAWSEFARTQAGTHASSISFFFFMSLIPLIIVYASLVPATGVTEQEMASFLCTLVPETLAPFITTLVQEAYDKSGLALGVSILTLTWTASQGATALRRGLNAMYGVDENRNRLLVGIISIGYIIALMATLTIVLYIVFSGQIVKALTSIFPNLELQGLAASWIHGFITLGLGVVVFAACYAYLTAEKRSFAQQLPGAILAAVAWFLFSLGFHIYLDHFDKFTTFYGSIGAVALFLFWMYCIFYILLACGFINRYLAEYKAGQHPDDSK